MRLEDIRVAGVHRQVLVEVIDQRGERRDFAGFPGMRILQRPLAPAEAVGLATVVVPAHAAAHDEHQRFGQAQAQGGVGAVLGGSFLDRAATVHVRPEGVVGRLRQVVVGRVDALARGQVLDRVHIVLGATAAVGAEDQFVFQAEGFELAVEVGVEAVVAVVVVHQRGVGQGGGRRVAVLDSAFAGGVLGVLQVAAVHGRDLEFPIVVELLSEIDEVGGATALPVVPGLAQARGAAEVGALAVGITRQAAPARGGIDVFVAGADAQGGVGAQVDVQRAIECLVLALGDVHV